MSAGEDLAGGAESGSEDTSGAAEFLADVDRISKERAAVQEEKAKPESETTAPEPDQEKAAETEEPVVGGNADPKDASGGKDEGGSKTEDSGEAKPAVADDELIERAIRVGISLRVAKSSPAELLSSFVSELEKNVSKTTEGKDSTVEVGDEEKDPLDKIPDLDPEEFPEPVVKAFKDMKELIRQQGKTISELKTNAGTSVQTNAQRELGEFVGWMDAKVASLGKDFEDVLGAGPLSGLTDAKLKAARIAVVRNMAAVEEDARSLGRSIPTREEAFTAAIHRVFKDKVDAAKVRDIARKSADRRSVNQPRDDSGRFSSDSPGEKDGRAAAVAAVENLMESA